VLETDAPVEALPAVSFALGDEVSLDLTTLIETRLLVQANKHVPVQRHCGDLPVRS
jgi:hypothetical protein